MAEKKKRTISDLASELEAELGSMDKWSPEDWYRAAESIVDNPEVRTDIPSGNLNFLNQAVEYHRINEEKIRTGEKSFEGYARGIRRHLQRALPGQWGHIAIGKDPHDASQINIYREVLDEINKVDTLDDKETIELAREIITDSHLNQVPGQEANLKTLRLMVEAYDRRLDKEGSVTAREYLHNKSGPESKSNRITSIKRIIAKSYLPNLTTYIAKQTAKD
jgi:hypothetical protein